MAFSFPAAAIRRVQEAPARSISLDADGVRQLRGEDQPGDPGPCNLDHDVLGSDVLVATTKSPLLQLCFVELRLNVLMELGQLLMRSFSKIRTPWTEFMGMCYRCPCRLQLQSSSFMLHA